MASFSEAEVDDAVVQPCETKAPEPPEAHWIEIELVYENDGKPVQFEEYCIKTPDDVEYRGFLNGEGKARVENIEKPGDCEITFPSLDKEAWKPA